VWTISSDPNCAAFMDGLIPFDADTPTQLFMFFKSSFGAGFMGTSRFGLDAAGSCCASSAFQLASAATPVPSHGTPLMVNLHCNNLFYISPPTGTTYFAPASDMTRAALLEGLCVMDQVLTGIYAHNLGTRTGFYRNTRMPGITSTRTTMSSTAWFLSTSATPPSIPSSPIPVTVRCTDAVFGVENMNNNAIGVPGAYSPSSDLRAAAIHQGLITYGASDTLIYVHDQGETKDYFFSFYQNGIFSNDGTSGGSIQLTASATPPTIQGPAVTPISFTRTFTKRIGTFLGSTLYRPASEIGTAAIHSGMASLSTPASLWIHYLGVLTNPCFYGTDNNGLRSDASDCSSCGKYILSTSSTTHGYASGTPDMTWIDIVNYQPSYFTSLQGTHLFGLTSNVALAAWAMNMLNRGETSIVLSGTGIDQSRRGPRTTLQCR
jgi:hypothetical protein